jgi:hypothetical protein
MWRLPRSDDETIVVSMTLLNPFYFAKRERFVTISVKGNKEGNMNRVLRTIATTIMGAGLLAVGFSGVGQVSAQTAGNGIKVSPVRTEVTMNPGESRTVSFNVQNITSTSAEYSAVINDMVAKGEDGQAALILDADQYAPSHSLKRYISAIPNVQIDAGKFKEVKATITIPKDAAGGGYYGAVRFVPAGTQIDKNVTLSASVASIILVRVNGDITENMTIESFDVRRGEGGLGGSSFFTTNKNLFSVVRFRNKGNVHEQPFGKVRVLKGDKVVQETEINKTDPRGNVLPDSVRRFDTELTKLGSFGKYTVQGNFGYGSNGQLLSATTSFWVIPLPLIVGVIIAVVVVLALIFAVPKAVKKYNRNVLRKAGRR